MLYAQTTDCELVLAWQAGDKAAGAQLFARHYASITRFFQTKVGDEREDLIQATFLACVEGIDRYRGDSNFRNYLFGVARNKLLRHLRTRARDQVRFDPAKTSITATGFSGTALVASRRNHDQLATALRQLPVDTQLMLELFYWEEMRVRDIAEVVQLPLNTVKCRMRRGREQLVRELEALTSNPVARRHEDSRPA